MQMNGRKLVIWLETDVGIKLPLTSFDVTHPGLAVVKVDMFWQPTSHPNIGETETEQERLLKLKRSIKMHSIKHHTDLEF